MARARPMISRRVRHGRERRLVFRSGLGALFWLAISGCAAAPATDEEKSARLDAMISDISGLFPDVRTVTVAEVGRLIEKDSIVLIDVREDRERAVSMIPGAVSAAEFEADPDRYAGVAAVAYCTIGHRSSEYAKRLTAEGHDVYNLTGSILAWTHAGGPLVTEDGSTNRLHVYGERWNLAPERYETIW